MINLAFAEVLLGNDRRGLDLARRAVEVLEGDVYAQDAIRDDRARPLILAGRHDEALELLEQLIERDYWGTPINRHLLDLYPEMHDLRDDPRFQALRNRAPIEAPWQAPGRVPVRELLASL